MHSIIKLLIWLIKNTFLRFLAQKTWNTPQEDSQCDAASQAFSRYYWTHTQNIRESGEGGAVMPSTHLHRLKALPQRRGRFRSADSCLANTDTPLLSSSVSFHSSLSSCGWWENVPVEIHLVYCFFFQHWEWWGFVYTISLDILDKSPVYQSSTDCHIPKDMKFVHHIWPIPWWTWAAAVVLAWESLCDLTSPSTNT